MGSGWSNDDDESVTVPASAGPNDPQIRIVGGADVPAEIATIDGQTIVAAILWYADADHFHFYAIGAGGSTPIYRGFYADPNVFVLDRYTAVPALGQMSWIIGSLAAVSPDIRARFQGCRVEISDLVNGPPAAPFLIDGISAGRGSREYLAAPGTPLASSTGAEVTAATSTNVTFVAGRAYRFRFRARVISTLAGQAVVLRLRAGSLGASVGFHACVTTTLGDTRVDEFIAGVDIATGDVTSTVALTIAGGTGANPATINGAGTLMAEVEVQDAGEYTNFPNCTAIT